MSLYPPDSVELLRSERPVSVSTVPTLRIKCFGFVNYFSRHKIGIYFYIYSVLFSPGEEGGGCRLSASVKVQEDPEELIPYIPQSLDQCPKTLDL